MSSLAYPFHVRTPEKHEPCDFCKKQRTGSVMVWDNSGRYTNSQYITYCDEHKEQAEAKKRDAESRRYEPKMWE